MPIPPLPVLESIPVALEAAAKPLSISSASLPFTTGPATDGKYPVDPPPCLLDWLKSGRGVARPDPDWLAEEWAKYSSSEELEWIRRGGAGMEGLL